MTDQLIALRTSLAEQLSALRGVAVEALPPALLDIAVRRVGQAYYVCPSSWEQLRHEEGGAGQPVPYWARPWPSGVGLAGALYDDPPAAGTTVLELGCGLALPSVMAARAGALVLATDGATDAVAFAAHVLALNEVVGEVAHVDWSTHGDALVARGPFDLVLAADVLYTKANADAARELFPRLVAPGGRLVIADPNRAGALHFLAEFEHETEPGPDVSIHTLRFDREVPGHT
ncbi:methyltransferase domain-containing protein [Solirubrobacter phytolaccae]|uniref:Methyltransferase domain-containing protein n=1 Tax=Solirubrobacter phytolaccae TaxID=1404360 RepID=A0A9X3N885_9ACTN|nr:methyltransferase domain-containing protein [Solirubrobacter phytolaccae]MDA0180255.1 methyltransferase domain-containing protein [Solirubrobacter phytolaccae]